MALLARDDILAYLDSDDEIPGAIRWAKYHGLEQAWDQEGLVFTVCLKGRSERDGGQEPYLLVGTFEDYRVMPPAWSFLDPRTGADIGRAAFPAPGPFPLGSVLHATRAVICAPWNRLAYSDRGGPHSDWDAANWQTAAPQYTSARTIPDMLARIRAEVIISPARLAPLPALTTERS
jgi:hypothetical protein